MKLLSFGAPRDGAVLTETSVVLKDGVPSIRCSINAPEGYDIKVNGVPCVLDFGTYEVTVPISEGKNHLVADNGSEKCEIDVFYLGEINKKYRFSLDDNIWFLQNLTKNADKYNSMFEDPWLGLLRSMNEKYGTKFHLNIYFECPEHGGFNLTQMTDKFKPEWEANADWLRLSMHARSNDPARPYQFATYDQVCRDFKDVEREILRFAGEKAYAKEITTIHWGDANEDVVRAMRDCGVRAMVGTFEYGNAVPIAYHLDAEQCATVNKYGFYYDKKTDMFFWKYSLAGIQGVPLDVLPGNLKKDSEQNPLYSFQELCVHEQYFYEDFYRYMPDYPERFEAGIRWCVENGYESTFMTELFGF